jgi:hypothetical protein
VIAKRDFKAKLGELGWFTQTAKDRSVLFCKVRNCPFFAKFEIVRFLQNGSVVAVRVNSALGNEPQVAPLPSGKKKLDTLSLIEKLLLRLNSRQPLDL